MYEVAIIGGGISGLALAIDLQRRGYGVVVLEKGAYPRQKVCGEYLSMESYEYLHAICPALNDYILPKITHFSLTAGHNKKFSTKLDLGGFGVSRYLLEDLMYKEAVSHGVKFLLTCKAQDIIKSADGQGYTIKTEQGPIQATLVCNATGRKSNLKVAGNNTNTAGANYVGIKYHVKLAREHNLVEIHNFSGGYCGISDIEEGKSCLCYIVNAKYLKKAGNSVREMEEAFLYQNSNLKHIFNSAEFITKEPVTVSGVNFLIKKPVTDDCFYLGDAAGSVAPLVGNGMSMGLRSAWYLAQCVDQYFSVGMDRQQLNTNYHMFWNKQFATRIKFSRSLQKLSENPFLASRAIELFNVLPMLANGIIRRSHGTVF